MHYRFEPVTVMMPCSSVEGQTASDLVNASTYLAERGVRIHLLMPLHCSDVVVARNICVHEFLKAPPELAGNRAIFIDSDMKFLGGAVHRMALQTEHVVGATYAKKKVDPERLRAAIGRGEKHPLLSASEPMFRPLRGGAGEQKIQHGADSARLVEVERLPTGFLSLSRECLLRMAETSEITYDDAGEAIPQVFRRTIADGRAVGEDYDFCDRWRSLDPANKCYLDLAMRLGHIGKAPFYCNVREVFPDFETVMPTPGEMRDEHEKIVRSRFDRLVMRVES